MELWIEKYQNQLNEFIDIVPEDHQNFQYLKKIFMRKVRRNYENCSDFDSEKEEEDTDVNNGGEWDVGEEEEDICPDECSTQIYETVIQLRDSRLQHEEEIKVFQREVERLKQTYCRFCAKERQANKDAMDMKEKIQLFQTKKQHAFNEINTAVPFSLKQMSLWEDNDDIAERNEKMTTAMSDPKKINIRVHTVMGECVIFSYAALYKLRQRIQDLLFDIKDARQHFNFLQKEWRRMKKEVSIKQQCIHEQKERCKELQILKFGQLVDIDALDKISVGYSKDRSKASAEKITKIAEKNRTETTILETEQLFLRRKLKDETIENTSVLNQIAKLSERQIILEDLLEKGRKNTTAVKDEFIEKLGVEEEERLKRLHINKEKEIDKLKGEIKRLERKDGVYIK